MTTGGTYRLMTEAEAEYIARASTTATQQPRYFFGNEQRDICTFANGADATAKAHLPGWEVAPCADAFVYTAPAASFRPNPFGVYDVAGNVWTWVEDCYVDNYSNAPTNGRVVNEFPNCDRALRGGSWIGRPEELGAAVRSKTSGLNRVNIDGFRVAKTISR
jgi:formylglycine-generating enzyme required for sulfatase activity